MARLKDIKTDSGDIPVYGFIRKVEPKKGNLSTYLSVTFYDGESEAVINIFQEPEAFPFEGKAGTLTLYKNGQYINVRGGFIVDPTADLTQFARCADINTDKEYRQIISFIKGMKGHVSAKTIALDLLSKYEVQWKKSGAAQTLHHAVLGGLLQHSFNVARNCMAIAKTYPNIDRELLFIGAILHDVGKLQELSTDDLGVSNYTKQGKLFGHIVLGCEMVSRCAEEHGIADDDEDVMMIKHIILSHHGSREYGSPVLPATPEALIVSQEDYKDSRIYMMQQEMNKIETGEFGILNRNPVYKSPTQNYLSIV